MSYNVELKEEIVSALENRVLTIIRIMLSLNEEGYEINNNKLVLFNFSSILIHAFENIGVFTEEQQKHLELLFNRVK